MGILPNGVLLVPLRGEEGHGAALGVLDDDGAGGFGKGGQVAEDPGAAIVGEFGEDGLGAVFVFESVLHDFELELADGGEDDVVFVLDGAEHLDGPFLNELEASFIK